MRKTFLIFGVLGLMMIWSTSGWAQDLKELERRIDIMSDELDALKESGGGGLAERVHVHGYGELHFNLPTDGSKDGVFDNHRYVLGVNAKLADWIHLNVEIDFEHAAQEMEFEFGYLDFLLSPKLNARAGVMLVPMGFLNEYHEPPLFWTVERPTFQKKNHSHHLERLRGRNFWIAHGRRELPPVCGQLPAVAPSDRVR